MRYGEIKKWKDTDFKRLIGVKHETFNTMVAVLDQELPSLGLSPKLSWADQLLMTLMYWREHRTQFHIAGSYGISEATAYRMINRVEEALVRSGELRLPGKKVLQPSDTLIEVMLVDVSEQPIECPKKAKRHYSGKKKRHTQKAQVIIHRSTMQIIATAFASGSTHDFHLFKESETVMAAQVLCLANAGYQGLTGLHANS